LLKLLKPFIYYKFTANIKLLLLLQPFANILSRPSISVYHYIPEDLYYQMNVKITFVCSLYRIHDSPIHACTVNHLEMRVRVAFGHAGLTRVYSDILIYLYTWSRQNFCKRLYYLVYG